MKKIMMMLAALVAMASCSARSEKEYEVTCMTPMGPIQYTVPASGLQGIQDSRATTYTIKLRGGKLTLAKSACIIYEANAQAPAPEAEPSPEASASPTAQEE
jgi:hypothetical protein